jgi:hypothetical protein
VVRSARDAARKLKVDKWAVVSSGGKGKSKKTTRFEEPPEDEEVDNEDEDEDEDEDVGSNKADK